MNELNIRKLGIQEYYSVFERMRNFTRQRTSDSQDEFWSLQHQAVFTLGANADQQHILSQTLLKDYDIDSQARADAHGVYVDDAKIASLGLRVHGGCSYHGVALNVDMDLDPFALINPCGFPGLEITQLKDHGVIDDEIIVADKLSRKLCEQLEYTKSKVKIHDN